MEPRTQRAIDEVARRQLGHLTTAQLLACGMSRATVRRHRLEGRLIQVGARTHRLGSAPVTSEGAALAACLDVDGVASHWTAAWLHGLVEALRHIEVSVVKGRSTKVMRPEGQRTVDVRIHTSTNLPPDDVIVVRGVPTTSVARTLLGLAALVPRELSQAELLEIVSRAVDRGLATDAWLWWVLSKRRCRGRNGVIALEDALSTRSELGPTESWLEREFLRILEEAGLPRPVTQRVIERHGRFAARVDFLHEPSASVFEVMGYAFHRTPAQVEADTRRANELQLAGFTVYQFTARQIVGSPDSVVATTREACLGSERVVVHR